MKLTGMGLVFKSIKAWRKDESGDMIKVNLKPEITGVRIVSQERKVLGFEFAFSVNYDPERALIRHEGEMYLQTDGDMKAIMDEWNKSKQLPEEVELVVTNSLYSIGLAKSTPISLDLDLPLPFQVPMKRPSETRSKYIA